MFSTMWLQNALKTQYNEKAIKLLQYYLASTMKLAALALHIVFDYKLQLKHQLT